MSRQCPLVLSHGPCVLTAFLVKPGQLVFDLSVPVLRVVRNDLLDVDQGQGVYLHVVEIKVESH